MAGFEVWLSGAFYGLVIQCLRLVWVLFGLGYFTTKNLLLFLCYSFAQCCGF